MKNVLYVPLCSRCIHIIAQIFETKKTDVMDFCQNANDDNWSKTWNLSKDILIKNRVALKEKNLVVLGLGKTNRGILEVAGKPKKRVVLDVFANKFSVVILKKLFQSKTSNKLLWSGNMITAYIMKCIANLKYLERFEIADNKIYGHALSEIGTMSDLKNSGTF